MAEQKLEERLEIEQLSDRAKALHDKFYKNIKTEIPTLEKSRVFKVLKNWFGEELKAPGQVIFTPDLEPVWSIGLHPSVANFDEEYKEYLYFKRNQEVKKGEVSTNDFFEWILTHEYGHTFIDKSDVFSVFSRYGSFSFNDEIESERDKILRYKNAIREGFAYWFGDSFSGFKKFNPIRALTYADKADPQLLVEMYKTYKQLERKHGRKFVIENNEDIAIRYVDWRERNSAKPNSKN